MSKQPAFRIARVSVNRPELLSDCLDLFAEVFEEAETYAARRPGPAYMKDLLANENFIALAAVERGKTVGALTAYVLPKPEQERGEIYIYDLAVASECRRQDIATALIEEVQELAVERGVWVIFIQADHGDEPAIALYSKLGVREDVLHFDIAPMTRD